MLVFKEVSRFHSEGRLSKPVFGALPRGFLRNPRVHSEFVSPVSGEVFQLWEGEICDESSRLKNGEMLWEFVHILHCWGFFVVAFNNGWESPQPPQ